MAVRRRVFDVLGPDLRESNVAGRNVTGRCVLTRIPGDIYQFGFEALLGQDQNSWQYLPICLRGFFRPEPKFLTILTSWNARRLSVGTKIPG